VVGGIATPATTRPPQKSMGLFYNEKNRCLEIQRFSIVSYASIIVFGQWLALIVQNIIYRSV
jgi:hypothetical protein